MKICKGCNLSKEESLFRNYKGKLKARCRSCENDYLKSYRKGERRAEILAKRRELNRTLYKTKRKNSALKRKYKITLIDYDSLLAKQNGVCAICGNKESLKDKALSVDHCHKTNKIRGLLCKKCNMALGLFSDNTEYLEKALNYLKQ